MRASWCLAVILLLAPLRPALAQRAALFLATSTRAARADACDSSYQRGAIAAQVGHSTATWRAGGFVSGLLFSYIGVAGAAVVASTEAPAPDTIPAREAAGCYRDGYQAKARARIRSASIKSALVGAAVLPLAFILRHNTR